MESELSRRTAREDILRGVYEDNKRIEEGFRPRSGPTTRTVVTGVSGVVLLVIALLAATNFVIRDAKTEGDSQTVVSGTALSDPGQIPEIARVDPASRQDTDAGTPAEAEAADAAQSLAAGPVPLAELFHLGVRTVTIDPGHGGRDPGASGSGGLMEKEITLDVGLRLARRLAERQGLNVILTRDEDETLSLRERAERSNKAGSDLFVSIHVNQFPEEPVYALETYYFGRQSSPASLRLASLENSNSDYAVAEFSRMVEKIGDRVKLEESRRLAEHIQRSLFRNTRAINERVRNWGVKTAPFVVLVGADAPGILAEIGVISNSDEETRLATPEYRERLALFLEEGIVTYLNELSDQEPLQTGELNHASEEELDD